MSEGKETYKLPPKLTNRETIGIVAPASAADSQKTEKGIAYLHDQGFQTKLAPNLNQELNYLAGTDSERAQYLNEFLQDDDISTIFCVRGGYGMMRILDRIDFDALKNTSPKNIIGYSDITVLQFAFLKKLGWITYSGPMVASDMGADFSSYSEEWLWKILRQDSNSFQLKNPENKDIEIYRSGSAEGQLLPGCLTLVSCLLGTQYCPSFENKILVIEDIGETGYNLDRLLTTLKLHGVFEEISGLILGSFVNTDDEEDEKAFPINKLLDDLIGDYDFPVLTNFAYGHIEERLTLPVGVQAQMNTEPIDVRINFQE